MKTRIALAALALLAVGCSKNENMSAPESPVNAKAIQIGQNVQGVTRAVISEGSAVTATVLMRDASASDWSSFTAIKKNDITSGTLNTRANVSTASFKAGSNQAVVLNPSLYYDHVTNTNNAFLVAVAPDGILAASGTVVTMKNMDGEQDVMYASVVDAGNEGTPTKPVNLSFNHLTTQLSFEVKMTPATSDGEWDSKTVVVKGISVQSAQLPKAVDAADGKVDWSSAASLVVPNIANVSLNGTASKAGNPVMLKGDSKVVVDVTLTVGDADLTISNITIKNTATSAELTTETAKSHLITLNVNEPSKATGGEATISATASVTPWETGANGSADLN